MDPGKAFELFVKHLLINVGFSEVKSDGLYIYDGAPGKMIQGLGESHNADVLLDPPVQTPFYSKTRLLIECKNYRTKVGLNTVRSVLGLREDINNFNIVDLTELKNRRQQNRHITPPIFDRYSYQVAIGALNGFTIQAQKFASTYRIPLLEFHQLPFWNRFYQAIDSRSPDYNYEYPEQSIANRLCDLANDIGQHMAVAVTNSGQLLFLYHITAGPIHFNHTYSLHWADPKTPWRLKSGEEEYLFQLPKAILKSWLDKSTTELDMKCQALYCKDEFLSNMVVYYKNHEYPEIKMISIDRSQLNEALIHL